MVLITDRGKDVPSKLDFLGSHKYRDYSKKGSLEQQSPKMGVNPSKPEATVVNPRRELVTRTRDVTTRLEKSETSTRPQATLAPPRRETRSQAAITKNIA